MGRIEIEQGDIARFEAGALVNAANNRLWMGGGVAGALKRAGGPSVEAEALARGPIPVGEAVATTAGKLRAKHVIHAAVMGQDLRTDAEKVRQATMNSLLRADELGLESIAFPALGTGVGDFPLGECARIMIGEVRRHLAEGSGLERVVFVLYDETACLVFRRELERPEGLAERQEGQEKRPEGLAERQEGQEKRPEGLAERQEGQEKRPEGLAERQEGQEKRP